MVKIRDECVRTNRHNFCNYLHSLVAPKGPESQLRARDIIELDEAVLEYQAAADLDVPTVSLFQHRHHMAGFHTNTRRK